MTKPAPLLDYRTEPAQVTTGSPARLTATGTKNVQGTVRLSRVTLLLPRGTGKNDLTGQDASALNVTVDDDRAWRVHRRDLDNGARIEIGVEAKSDKGNAVTKVEFTITGLQVNAAAGDVPLTVHERHPGEKEPRTRSLPQLAKLDGSFSLSHLQPTRWLVPAGESTALSWRVRHDNKHRITGYTLTRTTSTGSHTTHPKPTDLTAPLGPLHRDTTAELAATIAPGNARITQTTYVVVQEPRLTQVGTLTALGPVAVMDWPHNGAGRLSDYTRATTRTEDHTATFTSHTDGLLHLSAEADRGSTATANLQLARDSSVVHTQRLVTTSEAHLTLPVPASYTVTLTTSVRADPSTSAGRAPAYWLSLHWQPLGIGPLTRTQQRTGGTP